MVDVARYARHIALPEIGAEGQARISGARVAVVGSDLAAETAVLYLRAGGVQNLIAHPAPRGDGATLRSGPATRRFLRAPEGLGAGRPFRDRSGPFILGRDPDGPGA